MDAPPKIQQVRGVTDVLPEQFALKQDLQERLLNHFRAFGYTPIETPMLAYSELFLRKSGEDIISRMYDFQHRNHRLCLRPEMTASVIRAYVEQLQGRKPLPVRLCYAGSVFRYEEPEFAVSRQFTQVGVELIGVESAAGDAEAIYVAYNGLKQLGLDNARLVLGYIRVLANFLAQMGIEGQMRNFLMLNLERLRSESVETFIARIDELYPGFQHQYDTLPDDDLYFDGVGETRLIDVLKQMTETEARSAVIDFLRSLNISIDSNRDETEIIDRLLVKIRRERELPKLRHAVEFMQALSGLSGQPDQVIADAEYLLGSYRVDVNILQPLRETLAALEEHAIDAASITLDLGLSRNLQFYTGTVFELHHESLGTDKPLCGGGRYNDLVAMLGGRSTPATGFAYWLERLQLALTQEAEPNPVSAADVLVVPRSDRRTALVVSKALRQAGLRVDFALHDRQPDDHRDYALAHAIPYLVLVGANVRVVEVVSGRDYTLNHTELVHFMLQELDHYAE